MKRFKVFGADVLPQMGRFLDSERIDIVIVIGENKIKIDVHPEKSCGELLDMLENGKNRHSLYTSWFGMQSKVSYGTKIKNIWHPRAYEKGIFKLIMKIDQHKLERNLIKYSWAIREQGAFENNDFEKNKKINEIAKKDEIEIKTNVSLTSEIPVQNETVLKKECPLNREISKLNPIPENSKMGMENISMGDEISTLNKVPKHNENAIKTNLSLRSGISKIKKTPENNEIVDKNHFTMSSTISKQNQISKNNEIDIEKDFLMCNDISKSNQASKRDENAEKMEDGVNMCKNKKQMIKNNLQYDPVLVPQSIGRHQMKTDEADEMYADDEGDGGVSSFILNRRKCRRHTSSIDQKFVENINSCIEKCVYCEEIWSGSTRVYAIKFIKTRDGVIRRRYFISK